MHSFASEPLSSVIVVLHNRNGDIIAKMVAQLAGKSDAEIVGKYGGVQPPPPPFILGLAISLVTMVTYMVKCAGTQCYSCMPTQWVCIALVFLFTSYVFWKKRQTSSCTNCLPVGMCKMSGITTSCECCLQISESVGQSLFVDFPCVFQQWFSPVLVTGTKSDLFCFKCAISHKHV